MATGDRIEFGEESDSLGTTRREDREETEFRQWWTQKGQFHFNAKHSKAIAREAFRRGYWAASHD
jgi:hypothetical protein